jgi:hypothetical protein
LRLKGLYSKTRLGIALSVAIANQYFDAVATRCGIISFGKRLIFPWHFLGVSFVTGDKNENFSVCRSNRCRSDQFNGCICPGPRGRSGGLDRSLQRRLLHFKRNEKGRLLGP